MGGETAASWEPDLGVAHAIVELLGELQSPSGNQQEVLAKLDRCRSLPDLPSYLALILASDEIPVLEIRQGAGLLLKNELGRTARIAGAARVGAGAALPPRARAALLGALREPSRPLRHAAAAAVAAALARDGPTSWPDLAPTLAAALDGAGEYPALAEGALDVVRRVSEDKPGVLEERGGGEVGHGEATEPAPNDLLVPALLRALKLRAGGAGAGDGGGATAPAMGAAAARDGAALTAAAGGQLRSGACETLTLLAGTHPRALLERVDEYLQSLFDLAVDSESAEARKAAVGGLVQAVVLFSERLEQSIPDLVDYMLRATADDDEAVALEACEFWSAFCDSPVDADALRPSLPRLVPLLLDRMVFEPHDDEVEEAEAIEREALEREAAGTAAARDGVTGGAVAAAAPFVPRSAADSSTAGLPLDPGAAATTWNLRRCSAAGLDALATVYGDELLPAVLPTVSMRLRDADWRVRESAVLVLGAVAAGCGQGLDPHTPAALAALVPATRDPRPALRAVALWALSRFSRRAVTSGGPGAGDAAAQAIAAGLSDRNVRVQEAACGSLAAWLEDLGDAPEARAPELLAALGAALGAYGARAARAACDALAAAAEHAPAALAEPAGARAALEPLLARLRGPASADPALTPALLEALAPALAAARHAAEPYAVPIASRCLELAAQALATLAFAEACEAAEVAGAALPERTAAGRAGAEAWTARAGLGEGPARAALGTLAAAPDPAEAATLAACALDALGGLCEGLGPSVDALLEVVPLGGGLCTLAAAAATLQARDVRQSAFALLGDLCKAAPARLEPGLASALSAALDALDPASGLRGAEDHAAANNAAWALGEVCKAAAGDAIEGGGGGGAPASFVPTLAASASLALERLARVLLVGPPTYPRSLVENAAVALGRLAMAGPGPLAQHAAHFLGPWASALRALRDDVEKEDSFLGVAAVCAANPRAAAAAWAPLASAVASWRRADDARLARALAGILAAARSILEPAGQWQAALAALPAPVNGKLHDAGLL